MTFQDALDHIHEHLDDDLGRWARWRVRLHLWICGNCRRYLASYKMTLRLVKKVCGEEPVELPERLSGAILASRRKP